MFLPRVKQEVKKGKRLIFSMPVTVYDDGKHAKSILRVLKSFLPYMEFALTTDMAHATVLIEEKNDLSSNHEAYKLCILEDRIRVTACELRGLVNAVATLAQAIQNKNGTFFAECAEILDYPDSEYRSFMPDPARSLIPLAQLKMQILAMAKAKYNKLHLHLSDADGFCYTSEVFPDLPHSQGGVYSIAELREIVSYAASFAIDVVPEIDVPAHSFALTEYNPELKCTVTDGETVNAWTLCIGNEASYTFLKRLFAELCTIFPYEYIHIGTDELTMNDIWMNGVHLVPDWDHCDVCNRLFSKLGVTDLREKFYYFVRRMHRIVTSLGKKMMMWNDNIDISKSPDLPRDILVQYWRVPDHRRGPFEGCSMQRFLEEGFEVVNSEFHNAYLDKYMKWENLKVWNPSKAHTESVSSADGIMGGEMCAWRDNDHVKHYDCALPVAFPCFCDRLWNYEPVNDEKMFTGSLTRITLGCDVPQNFDLFDSLVTVPLSDPATIEGKIYKENADKKRLKAILLSLEHLTEDQKAFVAALIELM